MDLERRKNQASYILFSKKMNSFLEFSEVEVCVQRFKKSDRSHFKSYAAALPLGTKANMLNAAVKVVYVEDADSEKKAAAEKALLEVSSKPTEIVTTNKPTTLYDVYMWYGNRTMTSVKMFEPKSKKCNHRKEWNTILMKGIAQRSESCTQSRQTYGNS